MQAAVVLGHPDLGARIPHALGGDEKTEKFGFIAVGNNTVNDVADFTASIKLLRLMRNFVFTKLGLLAFSQNELVICILKNNPVPLNFRPDIMSIIPLYFIINYEMVLNITGAW